ncbi:kinase domain protein (macronuclear) [Tetrahymena thermophila SB210]|uniref:Kinase domain protein n=1 Tax=Tetrahymena thermophila (strain SB210) TaxID=312017 RepID=Q234H9_TETTS|nr:kinase domain protein [Tetrahymena thermophila SB210]EAR92024.1 kinase domain protein [Tetrahymena thermophila SB210]|eukprot:XP_001012269.1 kinase domain protein [Tetrahymena thermophila SB210]
MGNSCSQKYGQSVKTQECMEIILRDQFQEGSQNDLYEQLTKTMKQKTKFKIQEQAFTCFKTLIEINTCSTSSTMDVEMDERSILNSINSNEIIRHYQDFNNYKYSIQQLEQILESQKMFSEKDVQLLQQHIGKGSQGSVEINFLQLSKDRFQIEPQFIPIATKKFEDKFQFIRESAILTQLDKNIRPVLAFIGNNKSEIHMELCMCTLGQFKSYIHKNNLVTDNLLISLLLNLLLKLQYLLNKGIFHGDIKPENIAITLRQGHAAVIFLDFGASSWDAEDYLNYYTPAFCKFDIFQMIDSGQILNKDQIRYAEIFSICRTIQYVMLPQASESLFNQKNISQFIQLFEHKFPSTITFLECILLNNVNSQISESQLQVLLQNLKNVTHNINFDEQQLFQQSSIINQI